MQYINRATYFAEELDLESSSNLSGDEYNFTKEIIWISLRVTRANYPLVFDHFIIQSISDMTDSTSSCPFGVRRYSTRGGISLYDCLLRMPLFSSSLSLEARVLLLIPFNACRNCLYLTGLVVQQRGIRISSVPLLVIILRNFAVSTISESTSYPQPSIIGSFLVSIAKLTVTVYP